MKHLKFLLLFACALLFFSACKKDDDTKVSPKSPFYFSANIDGKDYYYDLKGGYDSGAGTNHGSSPNSQGIYEEWQTMSFVNLNTPTFSRVVDVYLLKGFAVEPTDCSAFENMFKLGNYPTYSQLNKTTHDASDGPGIYYTDAAGTTWSSDLGSQTGSTFEIVEHIANNVDGKSKRISKARFTCKLYNNSGQAITLKNGEIRSRSVQCGSL